jgi:hypothetical protein
MNQTLDLATTRLERALAQTPEEEREFWTNELAEFAMEIGRKLHGTGTSKTVAKGFENACTLADIALELVGGDPGETLKREGLAGLGKHLAGEIKKACTSHPSPAPFGTSQRVEPIALLHIIAQTSRNNARTGLETLATHTRDAETERAGINLCLAVLETAVGRETQKIFDASGTENIPMEEFLEQAIPRICGVPTQQIPGIWETSSGDKPCIRLGQTTHQLAKNHYRRWKETLPKNEQEFLESFGTQDWFDIHIRREEKPKP